MPDADEAGKRYEANVVASLRARNIEQRIVSFADSGAKDVSEFIEQGGKREDLVKRIGSDWVQTTEGSPIIAPSGSVADI
jgi:DNA primase